MALPNEIVDMSPDVLPVRTPKELFGGIGDPRLVNTGVGYTAVARQFRSSNLKSDTQGWQMRPNGEVESNGARLVSTHFTPVLFLKGLTVYVSDGTTPNSALSGNAGDICLGADSGKAYKCTSTTTWVSFT